MNPNQPPNLPKKPKFSFGRMFNLYQFWMILLSAILISSLVANLIIAIDSNNRTTELKESNLKLTSQRNFQKTQKDQIRNLWESQASLNDELVIKQEEVIRATQSYTEELSRSIRFVNETGQIIEDSVNPRALESSESDMIAAINELDALIEKNSVLKENNTRQINALYLDAGEDQPNRLRK